MMKEQRMFYGDYKKIENLIPMDKYDEGTKEAVLSLGECKKYTAINKDNEEFTFYTTESFDSKFPAMAPISHIFLVENGSNKQDFMSHSFGNKIAKGTVGEWKYLKLEESITAKELLDALKNNKFY